MPFYPKSVRSLAPAAVLREIAQKSLFSVLSCCKVYDRTVWFSIQYRDVMSIAAMCDSFNTHTLTVSAMTRCHKSGN